MKLRHAPRSHNVLKGRRSQVEPMLVLGIVETEAAAEIHVEKLRLDLIDAGFVDTFREFEKAGGHYTWWSQMNQARTRNIGWRIDYFLCSAALRPRLKAARIYKDEAGSDHCPVGLELKASRS